jgi:uncharacterized protein YhfF
MGWWSDLPRFKFGNTDEMADRLSALVIAGTKTATCAAVGSLTPEETPTVGSQWIVEDSAGRPVCVIETVEFAVRRFDEVDAAFARDEGEGDRTLEDWRESHRSYFTGEGTFAPDMELHCERFRLVEVITSETAQ